jgi:long-chain acyl-CoA synthetase
MTAAPDASTLGELLLESRRFGASPAITYVANDATERHLSYDELLDTAIAWATTFDDAGLDRRGAIALLGQPTPAWYATYVGVLVRGSTCAPLNHLSAGRELEGILGRLRPSAIGLGAGLRPDAEAFVRDRFGDRTFDLEDVPAVSDLGNPARWSDRAQPEDVAVILHTSGTTGLPKGVMQTHANHVGFARWYADRVLVERERVVTALSPCHQAGLLLSFVAPVVRGGHVVQLERFSPERFWWAVRRHDCTWGIIIPPVPARLLSAPRRDDDRDHPLRRSAGNNTSEFERRSLEERFAIRYTHEQLGSTETTLYSLGGSVDRQSTVPVGGLIGPLGGQAGGYPVPGWSELRVVDADGTPLGPLEKGEIQVGGRGVMVGYFADAPETAKAMTDDGWFRTGDLGYLGTDGAIFWVDRMHSMIRRSGENISPAELEMVIGQLDAVDKVAVFGVPDETRGEEIFASIVRTAGAALTGEEVIDHCRANLAGFKLPRYVEFRDDMPMTISFRPRRPDLVAGWESRVQFDRLATTATASGRPVER